jgi:hypothetical protein
VTDPFAGWADAPTYEFPSSRIDPGPPVVLSEGFSEPMFVRLRDPKSGFGIGWEPAPRLSCVYCRRDTSRSVVSAVMVDSGRRPNRFGVERVAVCPRCARNDYLGRYGHQGPRPPAEAPAPPESVSPESPAVSARSGGA